MQTLTLSLTLINNIIYNIIIYVDQGRIREPHEKTSWITAVGFSLFGARFQSENIAAR